MDPLSASLLLASRSPRRKQLLQQAGFNFRVEAQDVPEGFPDDMPVEQVAAFLAEKKAQGNRHLLRGEEVLLTADSVVILNDTIFGKPEDKPDATRILQQLSGQVHTVITGVCLLRGEEKRVFSGQSLVHMKPLSNQEIEYYIDQYQPFDKAGAYAIQEWIGLCKITQIEGTYANIMGLPVNLVYEHLEHFQ